jgi:hypothetical protein
MRHCESRRGEAIFVFNCEIASSQEALLAMTIACDIYFNDTFNPAISLA